MFFSQAISLVALAALVSANPTRPKCRQNEFYYSEKSCCLPHGGPVSPPSPPPQTQCPPTNWYWNHATSCCVPKHPPPASPQPPPKCNPNWLWNSKNQCCQPNISSPPHKSSPPSKSSPPPPSKCHSSEFYYSRKSTCLPHGGPSHAPSPPPQRQCPPTNWYWSYETSCCVPRQPPPSTPQPPPQCASNWGWNEDTQCCEPHNTPKPPKPSPKPQYSGNDKSSGGYRGQQYKHRRLADKSKRAVPCPDGMQACPITSFIAFNSDKADYECLDTFSELTSCGGCSSTGDGENCGAIAGAWNVGCEFGKCKIYTCAGGFSKSKDGLSCVPL